MEKTNKTGHTPGPWRIGNAGRGIFPPNGISLIADVDTKENARLIAAAPDLLDALYSILNIEGVATRWGGEIKALVGLDVPWHFDKVRAAIAKAEGKE